MKILHLADLHLDARRGMGDALRVLHAALAVAVREEVSLILVAGDFFERRSTPEERMALADWLQRASDLAPVVGCRGNHDAPEDLEIFNRLESTWPIRILDRATALPGSAIVPGFEPLPRTPIGVLALPWIDKAHVAAAVPAELGAEGAIEVAKDALRSLLDAMRAEASRVRAAGAVPLLVAHCQVGGSVVSTGQMLIGQGIELSPADLLDIGCEYVALGHIHKTQDWYEGRVAYAGSPERQNFGETEAKGCRVVTICEKGGFKESRFVELPARPIVLIEVDMRPGVFPQAYDSETPVTDASVRVRVHCTAEQVQHVDEEHICRTLTERGAHEVAVEILVEHETRARAPEIVATTSTAEKLDAWLTAAKVDLAEGQRERIGTKLADLEGGI